MSWKQDAGITKGYFVDILPALTDKDSYLPITVSCATTAAVSLAVGDGFAGFSRTTLSPPELSLALRRATARG